MRLNKRSAFLPTKLLVFITALILFGCASMQKPQGGPKDRTPPKLLKATPPNMTRNFSANQIQLDFDEYFKLTNQIQEITISPALDKTPNIKTSKKSIIIDFKKDTLLKNTTYVINFGKSIADLNEGNVLDNFTYVFSTGPHIDSLSVAGNVQNLMTQEKEKQVTVMLFPLNKDTLWGKKKPSIFAVTDTSGNFTLNNLHDGDYRIYALLEKTPNRIYDKDDELVAFQTAPIHLKKDTANIHLNLFKQEPAKFRLAERRFDADGKMFFVFNKPIENPTARILYPSALDKEKIVDFNKTRDTAFVFMKNMDFDSIKVEFAQNKIPIDTVALRKGRKEAFDHNITLKYNTTFDNKIKAGNTLIVTTSAPIQTIDNSLVTLNEDSTNVANYTITKDTATMTRLTFNYKWKPNSRYDLIFNEGALTSIYGDKNKKYLKQFQLDRPDNYGPLTLKVTVPDTAKGYVIELMNSQKEVVHRDPITKSGNVIYKNYPVGKYYVRVIYDDNKNGKWDSGNVKKRIQPENIWIYQKQITLRSNWEAEEPIDIPKEPLTH